MARVHDDAAIRAAIEELVREQGLEALTRDAVQARLKARAEAAGHGPKGASHKDVGRVMDEYREARRAEDRRAREGARPAVEEAAVPAEVTSELARHAVEVERAVSLAVADLLRQSETSALARIHLVETQAADRFAVLEADFTVARTELGVVAEELDAAELARDEARAEVLTAKALSDARAAALQALEAESRLQLALVQRSLAEAYEARVAAEARAHVSELERMSVMADVARLTTTLERATADLTDARTSAAREGERARDAERARDLSEDRVAAITTELRELRRRLDLAYDQRVSVGEIPDQEEAAPV
jgi:hypothetical protein